MKIITVANQKGGVGKTTTANTLAYILKQKGYRTLFVDADAQCNSTRAFHAVIEDTVTLYDLLTSDEYSVEDAIQHTDVGDIIASDEGFTRYDIEVFRNVPEDDVQREIAEYVKLRDHLRKLKDYDFVVIDTNPSVTTLLYNALAAADEVIIPIQPAAYPIEGLAAFRGRVVEAKTLLNPGLRIAGILLVTYQGNTVLHKEMAALVNDIAAQIGTKVFETPIRRCIKVGEAEAERIPLVAYSPKCVAALDYKAFADELLRDMGYPVD